MKKIVTLLFTIATLTAFTQELSFEQKKNAGSKVYELLDKYVALSTLKDDKAAGKVTDSCTAAFASLFVKDAIVIDDINDADTADEGMTTRTKTITAYLSDVKTSFPNGLNSKLTKANASFNGLAQKEARIVVEHTVNATDKQGRVFVNKDTLKLNLQFSDDYSSVKIASIVYMGGKLVCNNCVVKQDKPKSETVKPKQDKPVVIGDPGCPNDRDCDGVMNPLDNCPDKKGSKANNGCPDAPALAFEIGLNVGVGLGSNSTGSADFSEMANGNAYDQLNITSSTESKLKPKSGFGINAGLDFSLFFGKQQNVGLGTGVIFTTGSSSFTTENIVMEYRAFDKENTAFRRIMTVSGYSEKVSFTNLMIPILLKYRTPTSDSKKVGFNLEIGPVISVYSTAKSKEGTTNIDFEGIYSTSPQHVIGYTPTTSATDWLLTEAHVTKHIKTGSVYSSVADYFDKQYSRGYYVGLDKQFTGAGGNVKYKIGAGGLLRLGMIYRVSKAFYFSLGVNALLAYNAHQVKSDYQPLQVKNDFASTDGVKINSLLNSTKSNLSTQFGIFVGLHYRITK